MKIPQFFSENVPQVPESTPRVAAMGAEARAGFGATVADLGEKIFETELKIAEGKRKTQNAIDELKATNEYSQALTEFMDNPETIKDRTTFLPKVKYFATQKREEILSRVKDPELKKILDAKIGILEGKVGLEARQKDRAYWAKTAQGDLYEQLDINAKRTKTATTPEQVEEIKKESLSTIDKLVLSGMLDPDDASKLKIAESHKIEKNFQEGVKARINEETYLDPAQVVVDIVAGKYKGMLPEKDLSELRVNAEKAFQVKENEKKKKADEYRKAQSDEIESKVYDLMASGKYAEALNLVNTNLWMSGDNKNQWSDRIEKKSKSPTVKTDPYSYNEIVKDIDSDVDPKQIESKIYSYTEKGKLDDNDWKELIGKLRSKVSDVNKRWTKDARDYLESQIVPKRGVYEKILKTAKEEKDLYDSYKALDQTLEMGRKSGKPIEGRAIYDLAVEIAPIYKKSMAERMLEMQEEMKGNVEEIKKKKEISKKADKYKTEEEVGKDYNAKKLTLDEAEAILKHKFNRK